MRTDYRAGLGQSQDGQRCCRWGVRTGLFRDGSRKRARVAAEPELLLSK